GRAGEVRVVAAHEAPLRRRRREQHTVEAARWIDELQRRPRVVLRDDLLAGERHPGHAGRPAVRAVLAQPETVPEARAVEGDAGDDRERLGLALHAELAEPRDAFLDHVPREHVVTGGP